MRKNNKSSTLGLPFPASQGQLIEEFNSFIEMEVLDFYKHFLELNSNLSAEVDDFEILEENGKKFAVTLRIVVYLSEIGLYHIGFDVVVEL